jgi:hypothetical protein
MRRKDLPEPSVRIERPGRSSIIKSGQQTRDEDWPFGPKDD